MVPPHLLQVPPHLLHSLPAAILTGMKRRRYGYSRTPPKVSQKLKVYGDSRSGNCYKVKLLCSHLGVEFEWQEVDILAGDTHTPEFLSMNPSGKIPFLMLPDGRCLPESNAILCYLADGSELAGTDRFSRAAVLQWMFFEQYSHEPNIATARFIIQYLGNPPDRQQRTRPRHPRR